MPTPGSFTSQMRRHLIYESRSEAIFDLHRRNRAAGNTHGTCGFAAGQVSSGLAPSPDGTANTTASGFRLAAGQPRQQQ